MRYDCLQDLIKNSVGSRRYLLSLPVKDQELIHEYFNEAIHSAADLHRIAGSLDNYKRQIQISNSLDYIIAAHLIEFDN